MNERNVKNNKNKNNKFFKIVKNAHYTAINFSIFNFCLGYNNVYGIRVLTKLNKLRIFYKLLTQIKKAYKINYKFRNILNYNNKIFK